MALVTMSSAGGPSSSHVDEGRPLTPLSVLARNDASALVSLVTRPSAWPLDDSPDPSLPGLEETGELETDGGSSRPWWTTDGLGFSRAILRAFVVNQAAQNTCSLDLHTLPDVLGEKGLKLLLTELLALNATGWVQRVVVVAEDDQFQDYVLPVLLGFLSSLSLLKDVVIQAPHLPFAQAPYMQSVFLHPRLQALHLRCSILSPGITHIVNNLQDSLLASPSLRRLSLGMRCLPASNTEDEHARHARRDAARLVESAVIQSIRLGRRSHLEYIDLRAVPDAFKRAEDLKWLASTLRHADPIVQQIWLAPSLCTSAILIRETGPGRRLRANRVFQSHTQQVALKLLCVLRVVFHARPKRGRGGRILKTVSSLPPELVYLTVGYLDFPPLSREQVRSVVRYASDRANLQGEDEFGREETLREMDCWRAAAKEGGQGWTPVEPGAGKATWIRARDAQSRLRSVPG